MSRAAISDIVIAGAGPAGAALALLLTRAGLGVTVVTRLREYAAIEGISRRSGDALSRLGFHQALACAEGPVARRVHWGDDERSPNQEWLLPRPDFDRGLINDLMAAGVQVIEARVSQWRQQQGAIHLALHDGRWLTARWGVEARGRQAARQHRRDTSPWHTPALILRGSDAGPPASLASSLAGGGWGWWARANGHAYLQLALPDARLAETRKAPIAWLESHPALAECWGDTPLEHQYLRPSVSARTQVRTGRLWRLGDAAMAVDPLSGQGIFNALSSAHGLAPVLTSLLQGDSLAGLTRFHQRRQDLMYWRFARAGRDFYRLAGQADPCDYWLTRSHWPDHAPMHGADHWATVRLLEGHAIVDGRLQRRRLVVTPDQPLGIYAVSGIPLAPLVAAMQTGRFADAKAYLANHAAAAGLIGWWQQQSDWPPLPLG
ncbi:flavin-dependent monooxygenase QhpG [Halomonas sp. V046]|uniref:flavin-dependent monooxygenase QhpG n=1 Tax=Halomonas sp. V046 TaxID=3459611 RepID=UPI004043EC6A